ncbi:MAG: hypothetical protein M1818_002367 [Claussenomyces sp. TS43310]|nr:MAG: hypothetical protein M1818_002367 [Claussenomyces sp. TS43310]
MSYAATPFLMATSMSPSAPGPSISTPQMSAVPPKALSCVLCAQRKVKCDKRMPCSNCVKAGVECLATVPQHPRRRKRKVQGGEEALMTRLRRYERLLLKYGVKREELDGSYDGDSLKTSDMRSLSIVSSPATDRGRLVGPQGDPENNLWVSLSDEILDSSSDEELIESTEPHTSACEGFAFDAHSFNADLSILHPQPIHIFHLWQTFVDNVNPLVKLFHAPTVQQGILRASGNLACVSKPMHALMFATYSLAVTSMTDEDCEMVMGEQRLVLLASYHAATQQALMAANLLKTSDVMVLQAFVLFLALCILTGVALRLGQRLGLHREASLAKQSVFDAELGRRLWWQIILLESRTAELAGVTSSSDAHLWDTKVPVNVNDSDLYTDMRELPPEHTGTTEMTFCLMRYQIGEYLRHSPVLNGGWKLLSLPEIPLAEKEAIVAELEEILERKFLQYLDPVVPLHLLSSGVAKSVIDRLRLMCLHPRQRPDRNANMPQAERDKLFDICLTIVSRYNWGHATRTVQKYHWHINFQFQSDAFIYLLSELRGHGTGSNADSAWPQVLEVFEHHPDMLRNIRKPLCNAVRSLTLKAWNAREMAYARFNQNPPEGAPPNVIMVMRSMRAKSVSQNPSFMPNVTEEATNEMYQYYPDFVNIAPYDPNFTGDVPMDMSPIDWSYWNELIQNNDSIAQDARAQPQS